MTRRVLVTAALLLFFVLGFLPVLKMVWDSWRAPDGFSAAAYVQVLGTATEREQLVRSILLAAGATALAVLVAVPHVLLTERTDLPGGGILASLGVVPLLVPPILVAFAWLDLLPLSSFLGSVLLLGLSHSPFVSVLVARGLRNVDGRLYESALLARGRPAAERLLVRLVLPDLLAGALLVLVFVLSEHGVPEFLSVKGKNWFVYSEAIFLKYANRGAAAVQSGSEATASSIPLLLLTVPAVLLCVRYRRRGELATLASDFRPLPRRRTGALKAPGLLFEAAYLGAAIAVPLLGMLLWSAGAKSARGMSLHTAIQSFRNALLQAGDDLTFTVAAAGAAALVAMLLALPIGHAIARLGRAGRWIESASVLPIAVPGILLGIGLVRLWNTGVWPFQSAMGAVYDSFWMLPLSYVARFLPLAVLVVANAVRRIPVEMEHASVLSGRGPAARGLRVTLPLVLPAACSAATLAFTLSMRELDLAVTNPAGNHAVVRRLSHIVHFGGEDVGGAIAAILILLVALPPVLWFLTTGRRMEAVT
jgi:iron(III) transport system permease protein